VSSFAYALADLLVRLDIIKNVSRMDLQHRANVRNFFFSFYTRRLNININMIIVLNKTGISTQINAIRSASNPKMCHCLAFVFQSQTVTVKIGAYKITFGNLLIC